ncbi:nucleotidyl transferase AbiEii/AbiGii toxin family protein [Spirillospora sp. NPDC047279]|uniref:nucleotidyl transferase AbiEii/AbiGii toxin family protein n=1 Tax=Spirillospora sp. NPDC047279 TaxID=3155478 RepID=UPI00340F7ACA
MSSTWESLRGGPWKPEAEVPHDGPDEVTRRRLGLPATLRPVPGAVQRPVFDPALKQFSNAMRIGEPVFDSGYLNVRWYSDRRQAVGHVLRAIAGSPWADHLVLRGSVLLRAWYGDLAREPGDLDFVVVPRTWRMAEHRTRQMLEGIAWEAEAASSSGAVRLDARGAVTEDIWTYDRVPGRRLLLPWKSQAVPQGTVQLDFVFNEHLPVEPEPTLVDDVLLNAATPELSLAWKLMWLLDDTYPQAKDLFDALLLAEHSSLSYRLLVDAFVAADPARVRFLPRIEDVRALSVDWDEFEKEFPGRLAGHGDDHVQRLAALLEPAFRRDNDLPSGEYARRVELLRPRIELYDLLRREQGMEPALRRMADDGLAVNEAVVIANEILGRGVGGLEPTLANVMRAYAGAGSSWIGYLSRNADERAKILSQLRD